MVARGGDGARTLRVPRDAYLCTRRAGTAQDRQMTFRRLVVVLAFALAATAAAECPENKYVVSDLVDGEVACARGRVELV